MDVFVIEWYCPLNEGLGIVGVYNGFDEAVEGADAHKNWKGPGFKYSCLPLVVNRNNTGDCLRYTTFDLARGEVPMYLLRGSVYDERFSDEDPLTSPQKTKL